MLTVQPGNRFRVDGSRGTFIKFGMDPQEERLAAGVAPQGPSWAPENPQHHGTIFDARAQQTTVATQTGRYRSYYELLAQCLQNGGENPVPPEQALKVIQLIGYAKKSQDTGQCIQVGRL
jgi:predicted dehydrogenase